MKHNGEKRWGWVPHLLRIIGLMIGAGILFYPTISSQWNKYRDSRLISEYSDKVDSYSEDQYKEVWDSAKAYNDQHSTNFIMDAFDENTEDYILTHPYDTLLNPLGDYVMGYIEIPKIDIRLPIYHGVGTEALEKVPVTLRERVSQSADPERMQSSPVTADFREESYLQTSI